MNKNHLSSRYQNSEAHSHNDDVLVLQYYDHVESGKP